MYVLKDARGKARREFATLEEAKGFIGHGWTVHYVSPTFKVLEWATQTLHHKDKVSSVKNQVGSKARVGGQHSSVLVHKVQTGHVENRVW